MRQPCNKLVYIFIGGARDSKYENVPRLRNHVIEKGFDGQIAYYYWTVDSDKLASAVRNYKKVCPDSNIVIIGHSYGGDTAMDVAEALERMGEQTKDVTTITLVTLDPVSNYDAYNYRITKPSSIDTWINAYVGKGVGDIFAGIPIAGQLVAGLGALITGRGGDNAIASLGGKWGHERGADVNIRFNHWQTVVTHGNAKDLFTKSGNNTKYSAEDYLNYFLNL